MMLPALASVSRTAVATRPNTDQIPLPTVVNTAPPSGTLPPDAVLIVSTLDSDILVSSDGNQFDRIGLKGNDVAVAPDGQTLAYWRDVHMYVYSKGTEKALNLVGPGHHTPRWSKDGRLLTFVSGDSDSQTVSRFRMDNPPETSVPIQILTIRNPGSPVSQDPATGRLLIVENPHEGQAVLSTIDPFCFQENDCLKTRAEIATVPYNINWASYSPDGVTIVFAEDNGNIYLLSLETNQVSGLIISSKVKRQPVFSKDGRRLAFIDGSHQLHIVDLSDNHTQSVVRYDIASVDWIK